MKPYEKRSRSARLLFKRLLAVLLCGLCVLSCIACQSPSRPPLEAHSTQVIRAGGPFSILEHGPYVFIGGKSIRRYHRGTNLLTSACLDPECDGSCPLHGGITVVDQLVDGRLYFYSYQHFTHGVRYGYQDIVTGEVKVLVTLSEKEDTMRWAAFVCDGYLYYTRRLLREGGDAENPEDYVDHICRMPADGGDEEAFIRTNEPLLMVAEGKIVTMQDGDVHTYDIATKEKKTLFNIQTIGYKNFAGNFSFVNGKLYTLCRGDTYATSEYKQSSHLHQFLISVDIHTGEVKRVIEDPVIAYALTDDAIYYAPFELRHLYIPEDYERHPEQVAIFLASATLHACDLDGGNPRAVYTNEKLDYIEGFTVIDGTLYGWLYEFDDVNHVFGESYFGSIDLASGEITRAEVEE